MNFLGHLVMFGWIPVVVYLFTRLPAERAISISFVVGWLFLPVASFGLPGLPDYTKISATCYGVLLATLIFDSRRLLLFRPEWIDIPILVWCICPLLSSITNDLGFYDGFSAVLNQTVTWGVPYTLGRIYLNSLTGLCELATSIVVGGLAYVPFCLYEVRMSPQLHRIFYGFVVRDKSFAQTIRLGGFRPTVFMDHGLMVGMWMMTTTLVSIWLWRSGTIQKIGQVSMHWIVIVLLFTFVLIKSTGAYLYLGLGVAILYVAKWLRIALPLYLVVLVMFFYLWSGVTGNFSTVQREQVVAIAEVISGEERAQSLDFRFENEEILGQKAREMPLFGWGGWGRNRVYTETGDKASTTDSLWIITFGSFGGVGLASLTASLLLPVLYFCWKYPATLWLHPMIAPAAALAVVLCLYMLDCLFNAMVNPIFIVIAGGISGFVSQNLKVAAEPMIYPTASRYQSVLRQRKFTDRSVRRRSKTST